MSADTHAPSGAHDDHPGHGHQSHGHQDGDAHRHGTMRDYVIGFVASVILTAIPFWLVMTNALGDKQLTAYVVMIFAVVQVVVHMVYFLHMNSKAEGGWNLMALIFTVIIVVIALAGSLWVMYHMNTNMMPAMANMTTMAPGDMGSM